MPLGPPNLLAVEAATQLAVANDDDKEGDDEQGDDSDSCAAVATATRDSDECAAKELGTTFDAELVVTVAVYTGRVAYRDGASANWPQVPSPALLAEGQSIGVEGTEPLGLVVVDGAGPLPSRFPEGV